jgi:hypothetical protein
MTSNKNSSLPTIFANPIITVVFITALIFFVYGAVVAGKYIYTQYRSKLHDFKWSIPGPFDLDKATHMSRMAQVSPITAMPLPLPAEVYHIADQKYTYEESKCKCANYNGRLATINEIEEVFKRGGEWCGYGWTDGGYALYPTQPASYEKYKKEWNKNRKKSKTDQCEDLCPFTECGRAGINGGKFNKKAKFGINCYGIKPPGYVKPNKIPKPKPIPIPKPKPNKCMNPQFQPNDQDTISSFNKQKWSEYQNY